MTYLKELCFELHVSQSLCSVALFYLKQENMKSIAMVKLRQTKYEGKEIWGEV